MWIWPKSVPFDFFDLWNMTGTPYEWFGTAWPILLWGTCVTAFFAFTTRNDRETNRNAEGIITKGTLISIMAGVFEEITFRWLFFLLAIVSVKITNFFFFGFLGLGIAEWVHMSIVGPFVNWVTLGLLESYIFHASGWAVGAAMIATNVFFRDGHKYQGILGWTNSWFIGMFLFWVMFQYGLLVAILVHFTYDFLIFTVHYLDAVIERARGFA